MKATTEATTFAFCPGCGGRVVTVVVHTGDAFSHDCGFEMVVGSTRVTNQALAWIAVDIALRNNARGSASAADVCGVGFYHQERLQRVLA